MAMSSVTRRSTRDTASADLGSHEHYASHEDHEARVAARHNTLSLASHEDLESAEKQRFGGSCKSQARRKKTARERRAQKNRQMARAFQLVASSLVDVKQHRGGALRAIGEEWLAACHAPRPDKVPELRADPTKRP